MKLALFLIALCLMACQDSRFYGMPGTDQYYANKYPNTGSYAFPAKAWRKP